MKVISYSKAFWYLLEDKDGLYININSGRGAVGYSIEFQMNPEECEQYLAQGDVYVNKFAMHVNNKQKPFLERKPSSDVSNVIHNSIMKWNDENKI